jgi:flagellar biosynthesis protein FlhF
VQLRRFKGKELPEVLGQVRAELGPDAVILHTKAAQKRGLLRFLHGTAVEVVAGVDDQDPGAPRVESRMPSPAAAPPVATAAQLQTSLEPLQAEMAEMRRILLRFGGSRGLPSILAPLYTWLVEVGVDERLAFRVLDEVAISDPNGSPLATEALTAAVERRVAGMIRMAATTPIPARATIAFVGPTGAGKTTTLAKLAVRAHLEGRTPHVISLDAMSPGTPAPLEAISRILGIGHEVATTAAEVRAAVDQTQTAVRLIDTPGLGPGDPAGIAALATLLSAARPTEVHFVVPATMKPDDALATFAAFGALWVTRLTFTKLDETSSFGSLLSIAAGSGLPVSYLTAGREVPDDIQPATAWDLTRRVLRKERP